MFSQIKENTALCLSRPYVWSWIL